MYLDIEILDVNVFAGQRIENLSLTRYDGVVKMFEATGAGSINASTG